MAVDKKILNRFMDRLDDLDSGSRQSYVKRLTKERSFLEAVFNLVEEGILVIDRSLRIRYYNQSAKSMLSLPEELEDIRVAQLLPGIDWRGILCGDSDEWIKVARQELEISYPEHRYIQFYLVPYPGDPTLAAIIFRDVTESRGKTIAELESRTVKAVSLLAAGVAHEIGNPLNSLYLNLQLLEKSFQGEMELPQSDVSSMLQVCKSEVERLDSIIHSFLGAIRPGNPKFSKLDVREVVVGVLNSMRAEVEARRVEIKCVWSADAFPAINGDEAQLKQAFYNIVRNAVQAMTNGGTLSIYAYFDAEFLSLEFADSGDGITPMELTNMFKAFKTNKSNGNGIGTMIVERVCREHGAEFGIESVQGKGTVFRIRFPLGAKRVRMLTD